jgi:hypothetical protein
MLIFSRSRQISPIANFESLHTHRKFRSCIQAQRFLKQFAVLPGYSFETMKTVVKRINPAFQLTQPLPLWPVTAAGETQTIRPIPARIAATPLPVATETIAGARSAAPNQNEFSRVTRAN